jgi:hypothetical protein
MNGDEELLKISTEVEQMNDSFNMIIKPYRSILGIIARS